MGNNTLEATYRGGVTEPLHAWYPYLESYSPKFVQRVLAEFMPGATRILDPFAGIGTTPLTVARLGRTALYCELNPVLQALIAAKDSAMTSDPTARGAVATGLDEITASFSEKINECRADDQLEATFPQIFGESKFSAAEVFRQVLQARTFVDRLRDAGRQEARFVELAIISSLIPASLLVRRGDLRFKTAKELGKPTPPFDVVLSHYLRLMAADLRWLDVASSETLMVSEDARDIGKVPDLDLDGIVTSPPYLNGTNYFRNTKVELWFLRALHEQADLAALRARTVTAGINDVTVAKLKKDHVPQVLDLLRLLESRAYDRRIPQMVGAYFTDMADIFSALERHLNDRAMLALDIGDSSYAGVHVPTDRILVDIAQSFGWRPVKHMLLRRRASRDGTSLSQVLLVFRRARSASSRLREQITSRSTPHWQQRWMRFKSDLPHQRGFFAKRNWGNGLHSLCSYQGKMKPALAHFLIKTFVPEGGRMLDPFCGVGTLPFEAALCGRAAWGFDISPAALRISRAKMQPADRSLCEYQLDALGKHLQFGSIDRRDTESAAQIRFNGQLSDYFNASTLREVLIVRRYFLDKPPETPEACLIFTCLLHILHGNRPYALSRRSHPITPFAPTGDYEYRALLPRLREKVSRSLEVEFPDEFVPGTVSDQDATSWWPHAVDELDAIVTSPPFFNSTRFYLANWMRLWFCGWEPADFKTQPLAFVDERQRKSFSVYEPFFRQARERLKPDGVLVLHLGKSKKCDMASVLGLLARRWFRVADVFQESVLHCESHGIRDKGTVTDHQFLVLD